MCFHLILMTLYFHRFSVIYQILNRNKTNYHTNSRTNKANPGCHYDPQEKSRRSSGYFIPATNLRMHVKQMPEHKGDDSLLKEQRAAGSGAPTSGAPSDLNVKMQITFTFSVEDFHLLVALVTVHHVVHLTHLSHTHSNTQNVACYTSQLCKGRKNQCAD